MKWDEEALRTTIDAMRDHRGDLTSIEVKRGRGGNPNLATTLCAFGNMPDGGTIIVGLDEAQRFSATGVPDPAAVHQAIAAQARTAVDPPLSVEFTTIAVDGKQVVVAQVAGLSASLRPCRTGGRAYLRQADGDYRMSSQEEQQMLAVRDRPRFDASPIEGTTIGDLDKRLVDAFTASVRQASRRLGNLDDTTVLRRKGIVDHKSDQLTIAGLYALGEYPQQFVPSLSVTAAVVTEPGSSNRLIDLAHFDGPIPDLLDASLEWLQRNMHTSIRVRTDGHNINRTEFPNGALRELIANALVHRDLSPHTQSKQVEIRLLPDRLVISSPGGLWGVSREQLGVPGAKSAVNEYLYEVCRHLSTAGDARVIEGEGGGIREAERELRDWQIDPPIYIDRAVSFTVVLMRPNMTARAQTPTGEPMLPASPQDRIVAALRQGSLDRNSISESTGLSFAQAKYALSKLVRAGRVVMNGGVGARNTTYSLAEED